MVPLQGYISYHHPGLRPHGAVSARLSFRWGFTAYGESLLCLVSLPEHGGKTTRTDPKGYFALVDFYRYKRTFFHGIVLALGPVP